MSYLRLLRFARNDRDKKVLYISLHKLYNKKRNLLKTVALWAKGNLTPSSPPHFDKLNVAVLSLSKGR